MVLHDTPVTVAAGTGLPGLALFAFLLVALFRQAFRRAGQVGLVSGLVLAAIFCHLPELRSSRIR